MELDDNLKQLIEAAASDKNDSREKLIRLIEPRIKTYIYRSTLDENITDDILQEVYCKMLVSLDTLRKVSSFWPWLYRIASNCINTYYSTGKKYARHYTLQDGLLESIVAQDCSVEARLVTKELGKAVMDAISTLKPRHRQVITLRCFEELTFKEISKVEQTSEMYTRVIFHRAIEKLRLALKKRGFSKASLLIALTLFGKLTSHSKAAAIATTVESSALGSGAGAGIGAGITSNVLKSVSTVSVHQAKVAVTAVITAGILITGATVGTLRSNVSSVHYVIQGVTPVVEQNVKRNTNQRSNNSSSSSSSSYSVVNDRANIKYVTKGAYDNKLYMPEGPDGPVMRFMQRWDIEQINKLCSWLQDGSGNYYYHSGEKKVYITNDPLRMLILPTDSPDLVKFIYSQAGYDSRFAYKRKFLSGLIKYSIDNRVPDYADYKCTYAYNTLDIADLSADWPQKNMIKNTEDLRDEMHKRGWTCFEVIGQINGRAVSGKGRIPFIYNMYQDCPPWLLIQIGDDSYIDYPNDIARADILNESFLYKNETFFEGICKPWEGLPCVDSIRRDAAKYRLRFTTDDKGSEATITVFLETDNGRVKMIYDIDRDVDIIRNIKFMKVDKILGELYFDYKQNSIDANAPKFIEPTLQTAYDEGKQPRELWLSTLAGKYL